MIIMFLLVQSVRCYITVDALIRWEWPQPLPYRLQLDTRHLKPGEKHMSFPLTLFFFFLFGKGRVIKTMVK